MDKEVLGGEEETMTELPVVLQRPVIKEDEYLKSYLGVRNLFNIIF